jgi:hypothetical protein
MDAMRPMKPLNCMIESTVAYIGSVRMREYHVFLSEVGRDEGGLDGEHGLYSPAKQDSADEHDEHGVPIYSEGEDTLAEHHEEAENDEDELIAIAVTQASCEEREEDIGYGVESVQCREVDVEGDTVHVILKDWLGANVLRNARA